MDCRSAQQLLEFLRPTGAELSDDDIEALEHHLHDCPGCHAGIDSQRRADVHLKAALLSVPIPDGLRERLLARTDAERATWYRTLPRRHPRYAGAIAACLLFLLGGTAYFFIRPKPVLDLETILADANSQRGLMAEEVESWFARQGIRISAPPEFNYHYLAAFGREELQGKLVPRLLFVRGPHRACVYIVSASHFDLKTSLQQLPQGSGNYNVVLRPHHHDASTAYLILYSGDSLEPFLDATGRSAT